MARYRQAFFFCDETFLSQPAPSQIMRQKLIKYYHNSEDTDINSHTSKMFQGCGQFSPTFCKYKLDLAPICGDFDQ